ncbi:MAG: glycosyltransferase [Chromatiaceae bacterium]|nr:glycosyltransferase [Chromatiaceae bacterium]
MLEELPPPPSGRKGWPWTKESKPLAQQMPNDSKWPRISIVTPSYNQGSYIEETIRSVLLQNYPNLEYVVIDGGSTDKSCDIIGRYGPWLHDAVCEPDRGQSHALNKGFARCSGDIYAWLCSDDILLPGALQIVVRSLLLEQPAWLVGAAEFLNERGPFLRRVPAPDTFGMFNFLAWHSLAIMQPSIFWNQRMQRRVGPVNEHLHYCMDTDLWFRFYRLAKPLIISDFLSRFRHHAESKTAPYGPHRDRAMAELSEWIYSTACAAQADPALREELIAAVGLLQDQMMVLKRLRSHVVFGRLFRLWRAVVNRGFPA